MDLDELLARARAGNDPTGWFEELYAHAGDDASAVPWAGLAVHPLLDQWLPQIEDGIAGLSTMVVGCGLGDDAAELARRGAAVSGFDVSPTAIAWARRRFPDLDLHEADLFALPSSWSRSFDLVVEIRTIQSLPPAVRAPAAIAVGDLVAPGGLLVVIAHMATSSVAAAAAGGPPWPLAPAELADFRATGLDRVALDHPTSPDQIMEVVATFSRPSA